VETFLVESWLEYLRQHERITNADHVLRQYIQGLLKEEPKIRNFITPALQ
jgi:hypothetical protein